MGAVVQSGPLGEVGRLAYGCWRFLDHTVSEATTLIETALGLGMNLIDPARWHWPSSWRTLQRRLR